MRRTLSLFLLLHVLFLSVVSASAEIRAIDITIFGMD
jgi:hypothetical protein